MNAKGVIMASERAAAASLRQFKASYDGDGYACPIPVISAEEAADIRSRLESYIAQSGVTQKDDPFLQFKVHMVFRWADELIRAPAALCAVEALIGPNILVWNTAVLLKKPQAPDFVSWHQDALYWGNHPDHVVSAWIALADSTPETGCVRVIPGSHRGGILPHVDTFGEDNMLSRGQQIAGVDESVARDMVLKPGEMSLHHTRTVHASRPNRSASPRIGFVITYMLPDTVMAGPRTGATLVQGSDAHGHFDLETARPAFDLDPAGIAAHEKAMKPFVEAIYQGADKTGRDALKQMDL
jgi:ectoine hydroxylase-related dioxygenase (phytanoyl-CoA dioxygenase family)